MAKQVRFNDQVKEHTMSVDQDTHRVEVQNPRAAGIPMMAPSSLDNTGLSGGSEPSVLKKHWMWILAALVIIAIVGYLVWRYYFQKKSAKGKGKEVGPVQPE